VTSRIDRWHLVKVRERIPYWNSIPSGASGAPAFVRAAPTYRIEQDKVGTQLCS
jgi:hypothetical protein